MFALLILLAMQSPNVLTFDELLERMNAAHALSSDATIALRQLESPLPSIPSVRFETSAINAQNSDVFAQNVFRTNALTALVSVDYPLFDGGARTLRDRAAKLEANSFRQRMTARDDDRRRAAVEAAAQLFLAQERLRILGAALDRASSLRERATQLVQLREISNNTAAQWEEEALGAESQRIELELQRLDAETRVKQLIGDTSSKPIVIALDLDDVALTSASKTNDAQLRSERAQVALGEAEASRKPQLLLSAFGGGAALGGERQRYGIYGIRFSIALPMFDAATARRIASARLDAEEAEIERRNADERDAATAASQSLAVSALQKKIVLLTHAVDVESQREASVVRLVSAGIRSDADAAAAALEKSRRENDLLTARVELWRVAHAAH